MAAVRRPLHQPHPHPPAHQDYYIFGRKFENEKKSLLLKNSDSFFFYYSFIISCIIQMRVFVALFNAETNKKISLEICLDWTGWKLGIGHSPLHPTPPHPHEAPPTQHSLCAPEDLSLAICPRIVLRAVCRAGPRRSCGYS